MWCVMYDINISDRGYIIKPTQEDYTHNDIWPCCTMDMIVDDLWHSLFDK